MIVIFRNATNNPSVDKRNWRFLVEKFGIHFMSDRFKKISHIDFFLFFRLFYYIKKCNLGQVNNASIFHMIFDRWDRSSIFDF